ncbi:MAG TPA: aromatic ring-hydroxylating dioxygenase subunit alpha, partial [Acidimicrobiales bacterium]|nr:aromatic ring-hydroxylating dioxygenase subunit alpha [Acidimicrobiales bacterium]
MDPVPLDPQELERCLRPFGESRMLPGAAYTSAEVFAWEQRHFFGGWTCVAVSDEVARPGTQRAIAGARGGTLLVRDRAGTLRAFANACRHRGHELLPCGAASELPLLRCPYHSWTYRLDGSLKRAPGFSDGGLPGFDPGDNALLALPVEEWHGLVFVHGPGPVTVPLAEHLAGLDALVAPYEPERLVVRATHEYTVGANWKILSENYQECYHCPAIHPELCRVSPHDSGRNYTHPAAGAWVGGWMEVGEGAATMSLDGRSPTRPLRGLAGDGVRQVVYVGAFPNVLVSLHPDYVMTHVLTPIGADRTRVRCSWAFDPDEAAREAFDPSFAVDFWDVTNRQDW